MKTIKHRIEREKIEQADEIRRLNLKCNQLETEKSKLNDRINKINDGIKALLYDGNIESATFKLATADIKQITTDELNWFGKIFNDIKCKTMIEVLYKNITKVSPEVEQTIKPHFDAMTQKFN